MVESTTYPWQHLIDGLNISSHTIQPLPFQGEMCTVYGATSTSLGALVIKVAYRQSHVDELARAEIAENKAGFACIEPEFRPEILVADPENTILVMPSVGRPLRDILWANQHSHAASTDVLDHFAANLSRLLHQTGAVDRDAKHAYLGQLLQMGSSFLEAPFFPSRLAEVFAKSVNHLREANDDVVAFATLDMTQGNLLVDTSTSPHNLKIIDPKKPRDVRGQPSFLGIPEVDLGMLAVTLGLNAPKSIKDLGVEARLRSLGWHLRSNKNLSDFAFDLGRFFGCVLVASFPNSPERSERYLRSVNSGQAIPLLPDERTTYTQKALDFADTLTRGYSL